MRQGISLLLFIIITQHLNGQYIPNGSFGDINICCEYHISCAPTGWWTSSASTFNFKPLRYGKDKKPIPMPSLIKMLGDKETNERSFIQAPLLCPLEEGKTYKIELSYSYEDVHFNKLGILFSDSFINIPKKKIYQIDSMTGFFRMHQIDSLLPFKPQINMLLSPGFSLKRVRSISVLYQASGREKFILLGNFDTDSTTAYQEGMFRRRGNGASFLAIDHIALHSTAGRFCHCEEQTEILETLNRRHSFLGTCEDTTPINMNHLFDGIKIWEPVRELIPREQPLSPGLNIGQAYRIENIYFEFDSSVLQSRSFPALDSLANVLLLYPEYEVSILGHTDSLGSLLYNKKLSTERAEAVKKYLISSGIAPEKLSAAGLGSSEPLASNGTEEGRQINRRVEFILKEVADGIH